MQDSSEECPYTAGLPLNAPYNRSRTEATINEDLVYQ